MTQKKVNINKLLAENEALRDRLTNAEETLGAIQRGEVDALVVSTPKGEQIFAISSAEKPYRLLIEEMKEGAIMLSNNNIVLYCNNGFARIVKQPIDKIVGSNIQSVISPNHLTVFEELLDLVRKSNLSSEKEIAFQAKDNILVPTHVSATFLRKDNIETTFLVITDLTQHMEKELKQYTVNLEHEITQRKKVEEALQNSNKRLELISSINSQLLSTTAPQLLIQELCEKVMIFLNCDVFFNFLVDEKKNKLHLYAYAGIPAETAKTFEWLSFGEAVCGCAAQQGQHIVCENIPDSQDHRTELVRSFGVKAYCANPIFSQGKVIGTLSFGSKKKRFFEEDELSLMKIVTSQISVAMDRKNAEDAIRRSELLANQRASELEKTQKKLEEKATEVEEYANQMEQLAQERLTQLKDSERLATIGQVAGMVGHDIRNPLQAIVSDVYLAISEMALLPTSAEKANLLESLKGIEQNVDYISKIVADLQDYSRTLKPHLKETKLDALCNLTLLNNSLPKNVETSCKVDPEVRSIVTDPDLLKRILANLVSNAIQAMPNGGKLVIHAFQKESNVVLSIQDTGVGIRDDLKPKMFTPLFTTKSRGQGFGLPVVKRMTEALGGTVRFESEVGKGTTFTINLPFS